MCHVMPAYDTFGPQYPVEWDIPEEIEPEPSIFEIGSDYQFTYFPGRSAATGYIWTKKVVQTGKGLRCVITLADGKKRVRELRVQEDSRGEYLQVPKDIAPEGVKVRP